MARGRGRPRKFDEAEVKQAILQAFWTNGYAATSLDDLAKATGLVRPSLYGAFGSKSDMYLMAMDEFLEKLGPVRASLSSAPTVEAALHTFYSLMLDVYCDSDPTKQLGCFLVGTALADTPSNPKVRDALTVRLGRFNALLAHAIAAKAPNATQPDILFAADQGAATLHSLAVRSRTGEKKANLEEFAQRSAKSIARTLEES